MKRTLLIITALLALTSCTKELVFSREPGRAVVFATRAGSQPSTKTAYDSGTEKGTIFWAQDDEIGVYCAQASSSDDTHFASYVLRPGDNAATATLDIAGGGNGLTWGTGSHTFYCLYPSPSWSDAPEGTALSGSSVTTVIPATQTGEKSEVTTAGIKTTTFAPDMSYAAMIACTTAASGGSGGAVTLEFKAHFTAFEFVVMADDSADLELVNFQLSSTSQVLAATATATISGTGTSVTVSDYTTADDPEPSKTLTFTLGTTEEPFVLERNNYLILTVLALAKEDITNATLRFNTVGGYRSLALKYAADYFAANSETLIEQGKANASGYLIFPAGKKTTMAGFNLPGVFYIAFNDIIIGGQNLSDSATDWNWMMQLQQIQLGPTANHPYGTGNPGADWQWVLYDLDLEQFVIGGQLVESSTADGSAWSPILSPINTGNITPGGHPYDSNDPGSGWTISH